MLYYSVCLLVFVLCIPLSQTEPSYNSGAHVVNISVVCMSVVYMSVICISVVCMSVVCMSVVCMSVVCMSVVCISVVYMSVVTPSVFRNSVPKLSWDLQESRKWMWLGWVWLGWGTLTEPYMGNSMRWSGFEGWGAFKGPSPPPPPTQNWKEGVLQ